MPDTARVTARHSAVGRFFRNPSTGDVVVVQPPNIPLWVFLAATATRLLLKLHGSLGTAVSVIGTGALVVWSVLEVARGDSPFRRVLGGLVLLAVVARLLTQ